jgi:hypothetical protein
VRSCQHRLTTTGAVKTGFVSGTGFTIVANLGFTPNTGTEKVYAIAPLTDGSGKMYVGGSFTAYTKQGLTAAQSKGLIRLNSDWTVDNTFAGDAGLQHAGE